jgi:ATP-dependent Lhr-like helicase
MSISSFHPAVSAWFDRQFKNSTEPQARAWPAIAAGRHTLIAAPTGSGKTLAAFLAAIDSLVRQGLAGPLPDETQVVYVSPLKALSNDIEKNLQQPLSGIREELKRLDLPDVDIRVQVRTGDTTAADRVAMRKQAPHILVTTPESLYLMLTSESGRAMLASTRTVIVDEIHAIAGSKRGSHLALSLERLSALAGRRVVRVGLSATQKPIDDVARFLVGADVTVEGGSDCEIVDTGHVRERDLALALPGSPLEAVMPAEVWTQIYDQLAQLIQDHRTTLVFVNTRRLAERVARHLSERIGKEHITSHHGSMAKESRLDAEQRLKRGELRALVATASLELGIDIGDVDLVCQLGSPHAISAFLQRVGRSGHAVGATPKGRLFPLSRDELIECTAILDAVRRGELDRLIIPPKPLDVLAQQIVAEVASREWGEEELFDCLRRAYPYRDLTRDEYFSVVRMLSEGFSTRRGRRSAYLYRDAVNGRLRGRAGARLTALTCGGAIPDTADYKVVLEPTGLMVGTLNEDFAVESLAGDIFQLGNTSYRILKIEPGIVRVDDAKGAPPSIPFWLGEAPARTNELSVSVSQLRVSIDRQLGDHITAETLRRVSEWISNAYGVDALAADQITEYLAAAKGVLGALPTQQTIVFERFFDESGGMQLVIHAPFGGRINRAWGLALRKRFCRQFNFELQAAATEDAIVLSLGETHSFPLEDVARYLHSNSVYDVLCQALLDAPLFTTRWRWNATISLAIKRFRGGRRHPAPLQRMDAEDLIAVVFPDQIACAENLQGEREIPEHPLVKQTIYDCMHEAMDIDGFVALLRDLESGKVGVLARDLPHPSPLSQEILNAKPYAFLDDAPLEERRTQAVMSRRWLDPLAAGEFGRLDPEAIARVRREAWPEADNADELHDALLLLCLVTEEEGQKSNWASLFDTLTSSGRATLASTARKRFWVATEQLPILRAVHTAVDIAPALSVPAEFASREWRTEDALVEMVRGRLQGSGPTTAVALAELLDVDTPSIDAALLALESEGFALRGQFTPESPTLEWCERRLLARVHRYTVERLRAEIEPVSAADYMRFLFDWHGVTVNPQPEGPQALGAIVEQLEGFEAACAAWESDILPARTQAYDRDWLDTLCRTGRVAWARLTPPKQSGGQTRAAAPVRTTPIALLSRKNLKRWQSLAPTNDAAPELSSRARAVADSLRLHGASFFEELLSGTGLLRTELEEALRELVAVGAIHADSYSGLRTLLLPADQRRSPSRRRRGLYDIEDAGRWTLLQRSVPEAPAQRPARAAHDPETVEQIARTLLRRYGVVFRRVIEREPDWLPSWFELLRVYRRLEARGEIRGGRFVEGFAGEQYALAEAVSLLRATRKKPATQQWVSLSAADPLNLVGIVTPGARVAAFAGNRVLYRDGVAVAVQVGGKTEFLVEIPSTEEWAAHNALIRPWANRRVPDNVEGRA